MNEKLNQPPQTQADEPAAGEISATMPKFTTEEVGTLRKIKTLINNLVRPDHKLSGYPRAIAQCVAMSGLAIVLPEEWEQLQRWKSEYKTIQKIIEDHVSDKEYAAWEAHRQEYHAKLASGPSDMHLLSREEFQERFNRIIENAKEVEEKLYADNIELARDIADRAASLVCEKADRLEAEEKRRYDQWGLPFNTPSAVVAHLRKAAQLARNMTTADVGQLGPDYLLPYLPL